MNSQAHVQWFRSAAPYIKAHRKKTFVILIPDEVIESEQLTSLIHDLTLLHHLGIKLVILHESKRRIDQHLLQHQITPQFNAGLRVNDGQSLQIILQAVNEVKTDLESQLSMGLPNTPMSGSDISLISGNFVTGMPLGVVDGIDMQHSGKVRDIKHQTIHALLDQGHLVLISDIGYSRTGEVFILPAREVASETAQALAADKLIFIRHPDDDSTALADTLSASDCETLIRQSDTAAEDRDLLIQAVNAVKSRVKRVHIIKQEIDGGLLLELFTRDGCGTMVTNLFYAGTRAASIDDVGGILSLIQPLEASGILTQRSSEQLELGISNFHVMEKDGMIIACVACIPDTPGHSAELACLAVHQNYRDGGLGRQLLRIAEQQAKKRKCTTLYARTTRSMHWFIEQGFSETQDFILPAHKRTDHQRRRGSKILIKQL